MFDLHPAAKKHMRTVERILKGVMHRQKKIHFNVSDSGLVDALKEVNPELSFSGLYSIDKVTLPR